MNDYTADTLFLHIGTVKTGSTTIQHAAVANRDLLKSKGIIYPSTPGGGVHRALTLYASIKKKKTRNLRLAMKLAKPQAMDDFKESFVSDLTREIRESGCKTVLLSDELLSSRLLMSEEVRQVHAVLTSIARNVKVIVYLRPQHDLYPSLYSTNVKSGRAKDFAPPTTDTNPLFNYDMLLAPWAECFGDENMIVRLFESKSFVNGDLLADFFSLLGVQISPDFTVPPRHNTSLDDDTLRFLQKFNAHVPAFLEDQVNPDRGDVSAALEAISVNRKIYVPSDELRRISELFTESNAQVAHRYLKRADGHLFDGFKPATVEVSEPKELSVDRVIEIAAQIWAWKQRQLNDMRQRQQQRLQRQQDRKQADRQQPDRQRRRQQLEQRAQRRNAAPESS